MGVGLQVGKFYGGRNPSYCQKDEVLRGDEVYQSALLPLQAFSFEILRKVLQVFGVVTFYQFAKAHAVSIDYVRKSKLGDPVLKRGSVHAYLMGQLMKNRRERGMLIYCDGVDA